MGVCLERAVARYEKEAEELNFGKYSHCVPDDGCQSRLYVGSKLFFPIDQMPTNYKKEQGQNS